MNNNKRSHYRNYDSTLHSIYTMVIEWTYFVLLMVSDGHIICMVTIIGMTSVINAYVKCHDVIPSPILTLSE